MGHLLGDHPLTGVMHLRDVRLTLARFNPGSAHDLRSNGVPRGRLWSHRSRLDTSLRRHDPESGSEGVISVQALLGDRDTPSGINASKSPAGGTLNPAATHSRPLPPPDDHHPAAAVVAMFELARRSAGQPHLE